MVQLNPNEDKFHLLSPYPTLKSPSKKFLPEIICAIGRKPNVDLQSLKNYPKTNIHHIRTQQYQELLTKMETIQRKSIDQKLRTLAETAGFSDICTQD